MRVLALCDGSESALRASGAYVARVHLHGDREPTERKRASRARFKTVWWLRCVGSRSGGFAAWPGKRPWG